jgi:type I restriction enzyme R subunit
VDPDLVYVTTHLAGAKTRFLPFNQGKYGGAGNPPVPPTRKGYATAYLWEETWARDSVPRSSAAGRSTSSGSANSS